MPKGVQGSGPGGGAGQAASALEPLQEILALLAKAGGYPDAPIEQLSQMQSLLTQIVRGMHGGGHDPMQGLQHGGPGPGGMPPGGGAALPPELLQALSGAGGPGGPGGGVAGVPQSPPQLSNPDELKRMASMPQGTPN